MEENKVPDKYQAPEEVKTRARVMIREFMKQNKLSSQKLADKLSEAYGRSASRTNIENKLSRASFKITELIQIADIFNYELKLLPKDDKNP